MSAGVFQSTAARSMSAPWVAEAARSSAINVRAKVRAEWIIMPPRDRNRVGDGGGWRVSGPREPRDDAGEAGGIHRLHQMGVEARLARAPLVVGKAVAGEGDQPHRLTAHLGPHPP